MIKKALISCAVLAIGITIGGAGIYQFNIKKQEQKEKLISFLGESHTKNEIETELKSGFEKLSKSDCTEILDLYLHATYSVATQNLMDDSTTDAIYSIMKSDHSIDINDIEDAEIKTTCLQLQDENVVPRFVNGSLFFDVDYGYFYDTYGKYINNDYAELLSLYDEEKKIDYYDSETNKMNIKEVEQRLNNIYELIQEYPNATTKKSMNEYYKFYKCVYLGAYAQEYVFDSDVKINKNVLESYKSFEPDDPELKETMSKLINMYNNSDRTRTKDIYSYITNFCEITQENTKE